MVSDELSLIARNMFPQYEIVEVPERINTIAVEKLYFIIKREGDYQRRLNGPVSLVEAKRILDSLVLEAFAKKAEAFETPEWAARRILYAENIRGRVIDPCCGTGVLSEAARDSGHSVITSFDLYPWGYKYGTSGVDFLKMPRMVDGDFTIFMNPPFSLATEFVLKAMEIGASKIICFQRWAWRESRERREFWELNPPARVYICGDRATCWRADIPDEHRKGGTTTPHGFFVWDNLGSPVPTATTLDAIWDD